MQRLTDASTLFTAAGQKVHVALTVTSLRPVWVTGR
jgi:hypothetical protein